MRRIFSPVCGIVALAFVSCLCALPASAQTQPGDGLSATSALVSDLGPLATAGQGPAVLTLLGVALAGYRPPDTL